MLRLRRRSWSPLCLALVFGLALAWPGLAHHRLHQHTHEHADTGLGAPAPVHVSDSESPNTEHPHLDLTATAPTKSVLNIDFAWSDDAVLEIPAPAVAHAFHHADESSQPRGPPPGPPPAIRAPPTA